MSKSDRCFSEESIIDYILGKTSTEQKEIQHHLHQCKSCQSTFEHWVDRLQPNEELLTPPDSLKERVMQQIEQERKSKQPEKTGWKGISWLNLPSIKSYRTISFISVFFLFLLLIPLWQASQSDDQRDTLLYAEDMMGRTPFVLDADTDQYEIVPVLHPSIKGYVWVNNKKSEMFLLVEGLHPLQENDYQAWLEISDTESNAGLLSLNNGLHHLYVNDSRLEKVKLMRVSIEDKGGSYYPTGPETFFIHFKH